MSAPSPRLFYGPRAAFTLIELLAVMAIIGVLSGLLIVVVRSARQTGLRAECASNMRQVGVAMAAYTQDHRGILPGPLYSGMEANYSNDSKDGKLGSFLVPYLDFVSLGTGINRRCPLFACPAWSQEAPANQKFWGIQQSKVLMSDGQTRQPFGYATSSGVNGTPNYWLNIVAPGNVQALWDLDQLNWPDPTNSYLPDKPAHGDVRNVLFLDWHVAAVKIP